MRVMFSDPSVLAVLLTLTSVISWSFLFSGHKWKQGMWSKEEIDILMSNIERYLKVCVRACYRLVGMVMQLLLETSFL